MALDISKITNTRKWSITSIHSPAMVIKVPIVRTGFTRCFRFGDWKDWINAKRSLASSVFSMWATLNKSLCFPLQEVAETGFVFNLNFDYTQASNKLSTLLQTMLYWILSHCNWHKEWSHLSWHSSKIEDPKGRNQFSRAFWKCDLLLSWMENSSWLRQSLELNPIPQRFYEIKSSHYNHWVLL